MKHLLKITLLLLPSLGFGQNVKVYETDTSFVPEPVVLAGKDSTDGKITATYPNHNNSLAYEVNYYMGKKSGFVRIYYPGTTQIMQTVVYANGKLNGESTWYNRQGKIMIKGMYTNGVRDGFWFYTNYSLSGNYKDGLKHGTWRWRTGAVKHKMKFKKGVLQRDKKGKSDIPQHIPKSILMDGVTRL